MPTIKSKNLALTNSAERSTLSAKFHAMLSEIKTASVTQYDTSFSKKRIIIESPVLTAVISGKFKSKSSGEKFKDITGKIKSFNISRKNSPRITALKCPTMEKFYHHNIFLEQSFLIRIRRLHCRFLILLKKPNSRI